MFEKHGHNLQKVDRSLRFVVAFIITLYALYSGYYSLLFIAAILTYTAAKQFCFIYYFLKINDTFSKQNYYLTLLPKYNPSAVFIFDAKGSIVFKNKAASDALPNINSAESLGIDFYKNCIKNARHDSLLFEEAEKYFQVDIEGLKQEKLLLAYLTDVTQVVELNDEIEETQREIIYTMGEIGETRSKETGNHVKRVALYSKEMALLYGLSHKEADILQMASPMHDIGKVGIPDAILNAPRKLSSDEFEIMKTHASLGYDMLKHSSKPILQAAAIVANEHHEKWDGSGYPHGKSAEDIHIYGRITAVADVFDALGSERVYKKAWELEKILELFKEESSKHFDPTLIDLFLNNLDVFLEIREKFKDEE